MTRKQDTFTNMFMSAINWDVVDQHAEEIAKAMHLPVPLKSLKKGDFFMKKNYPYPTEDQVWIRDEYDRTARKYWVHRWSDVNDSRLMKGDAKVFTDMTF